MKDAVARLAYTRIVVAECKALLAEAETELHASPPWKQVEDRRTRLWRAKDKVADAKAEVRKQALAVYKETGDKTPHPAITVREATSTDREWGIAPPDGRPVIHIARDLSEYLNA